MLIRKGAILGLLSLLSGAYTDHMSISQSSTETEIMMTAIRYLQLNSVLISAIGLILWCPLSIVVRARLQLSAWLFILGAACFSFSLMLSIWLDQVALQKITPVGGFLMIAAWISLVWAGLGAPLAEKEEQFKFKA